MSATQIARIVGAAALVGSAAASASETSPISKVVDLLTGLQAKIIKEGETAQKEYAAYAEWCEDTSKQLGYEIKTGDAQANELQATIRKETANTEALTDSIGALSSQIATAEADLKAATEIRTREAAAFAAQEQELSDVLSAMERAIGLLTSEMAKSGASASMMQLSGASGLVQAFSAMVQASELSSADASRLTALVQHADSSSSGDAEADMGVGAPDASVYEGHSGNIIDVLEGLRDKADEQLTTARKTETSNLHEFQALQQSLTDEINNANNDMADAKNGRAASTETKEVAAGELDVTQKDVASDNGALRDTHQVCMTTAQDFEAATRSRDQELKALAAAKQAIASSTGGADKLSYGLSQVSLLQKAAANTERPQAVERFMLDLSRKQNSKSLAQLAARISSAIRLTSGDPFAKIKGLISDMISRLTAEGENDANHKAYCDKEFHESNVKHEDKSAEISKLTTRIDTMSSRKAMLEGEVAVLTKDLADIAKSQAEYDSWFQEFEATYKSNSADMEAGIDGVKLAIKILRDYYAKADASHAAAEGAGGNIIGLLEVAESDFTRGLAEMTATYTNQKAAHAATTKENEITTTAKHQDSKYKSNEITTLTKGLQSETGDRTGVQAELDAINEYLDSLHKQCDEKVEPYEETKRRREEEIAGLKDALQILEGRAVFLQKSALRGVSAH